MANPRVRAQPAAAKARPQTRAAAKAPAAVRAKPTTKIKLLGSLTVEQAHARDTKLAQDYVREHGFPIRTLEAGPQNRRITRTFVPILAETQPSFQKLFTAEGPGQSVILRHTPQNNHVAMVVKPGDVYLWGKNYNGEPNGNGDYTHLYAQKDATRSTWAGSSVVVHPTSVNTLKAFLKSKEQGARCEGHCMMWLTNAPVGKGGQEKALFHDLGLKRSRDGNNMHAKVMHAGNQRVGVIGIHVTSIEQFNQMTEAQLLGAVPKGGIEAAINP